MLRYPLCIEWAEEDSLHPQPFGGSGQDGHTLAAGDDPDNGFGRWNLMSYFGIEAG